MQVIPARAAAKLLGLSLEALYKRVRNGEIATVDPAKLPAPATGARLYAFDRDVLKVIELRPVGRPPTHPTDEDVRTYLRGTAAEYKRWIVAAREASTSLQAWLREHANSPPRKLVAPRGRAQHVIALRSTDAERDRWERFRQTHNLGMWLRMVANAAVSE